jgi:hypothetical protein
MSEMIRRHPGWCIVTAAVFAVTASMGAVEAAAQIPGFTLPPAVQYSGEVGSYGELYSITGREQRRPSSLGRLYVRSSLELFGALSVGLDLLYSTESGSALGLAGSDQRQRLNQLGIRPEWSWGRAYLGSFSDSYSSLTWHGVRVRGAGAAINPGLLRVGAFAGRSQSAVAGGALDGAYRRGMWGARVGIGRDGATAQSGYLDLVLLRVADDPSSLDAPGGDPTGPGSGDGFIANPYAVTPQENVVLAAVNRMPLWSNRLVWRGEVAVSVHSRDRRAAELDDATLDEYSGLLRSLITPRSSTYGDVAYTGQLDLRRFDLPGATPQSPRTLTASIGYRYIGAGYVSLGLASLPADQRALNASAAVRYRTWSASLQGLRQNDNLLGQKLATTSRDRLAGNVTFRAIPNLSSSLRASVMRIGSDAADPARRMDFTSWTLANAHTLRLGRDGAWRAVSFNHTYQQSGDANRERSGNALRAHDTDVRVTIAPRNNVTVTPSIGLSMSSVDRADWALRHTYAIAASLRGTGGRWSTGAALSNSRLHAGGAIRASVSARYNLTPEDRLNVTIRSNRVTGLQTETGGFDEYTMSIGWSRSIR